MTRFNAIHFDMDGILANTEPLHVAAEQQTCDDYDFAIDPDQWSGFKGQTAEAIFGYLLNNYGDPQSQTVDELIDHKTELFLHMAKERLEPIEGSLDFLQWARDTHEKVALVTSSNRRVQECIIGRFGVAHLFDSIITGDDISNGKPDPEPYLRSLQQTGSLAEKSLVIEDSKSGIQSGLGARCAVLAAATSHTVEELRGARPTFIAADFTDARHQLEKL
jgi:HAD superfamily hydrolase (TIGR01509 family)